MYNHGDEFAHKKCLEDERVAKEQGMSITKEEVPEIVHSVLPPSRGSASSYSPEPTEEAKEQRNLDTMFDGVWEMRNRLDTWLDHIGAPLVWKSDLRAVRMHLHTAILFLETLGGKPLPRTALPPSAKPQPHICVEYDRAYVGGNYDGTRSCFAYIPLSEVERRGSVECAFQLQEQIDSCHIIRYSLDELYTKEGEPFER